MTGVPGTATVADPGTPNPLGVLGSPVLPATWIDGNGAGTAQKDV